MDAAFATLGLAVGAQPIEITRAFRALSRASHPDHGGDRRRFEAVVAAYRMLQRAGLTERPSCAERTDERTRRAERAATPTCGAEPPRRTATPADVRYRAFLRDLDRAAAMVITPVPITTPPIAPDPTTMARPVAASSGTRFAEVLDRVLQRTEA